MLFTAIFTSFVLALPLVARSTPVVRSTPVTRDRLDDQINNLKVLDVIALGFEQFNFTSTLQDLAAGKTSQATTVLEALSLLAERAEFVAGYRNAEIDFELIDILAAETKNSAVQILAVTAIGDMNVGNLGINNIVNSILAGQTPSPADQKIVSDAIKGAGAAVEAMPAAIKVANATLASLIKDAGDQLLICVATGNGIIGAS